MLEKEMLLWKSFISLENIFRVESGTKTFPNVQSSSSTVVLLPVSDLIVVMASLMSDLGYVTEGYP